MSTQPSMLTIAAWRALSPAQAARRVHEAANRLAPGQRRAALASLLPEYTLAEQLERAPRSSPLGGVPCFLKDLWDVAGLPTLAGSTFLPEVRPAPPRESRLVSVLRDKGAVLAGKTHLHEFAFGLTGENPHYGDCEHPLAPGRTSGGSSSGSAVAVAAGLAPFAIGTDTGGSIRVPAAFCGLYGFRTVPHHEWIADAFPLAPGYDTAGWFTAHAGDMEILLTEMLGDGRRHERPLRGAWLELPGLDPEVSAAFRAGAGRLAPPLDDDHAAVLRAAFAPAAEVYGVLGAIEAWQVHAGWAERFAERYDPVVWQRLERARRLGPEQIGPARTALARLREAWAGFFDACDFLVLPASPCVALAKADCNPANRTRLLSLTAPASLGGLPVLTLPLALGGGPLGTGLQIVGRDLASPVFLHALRR
ncbi:amidase, Asp-tRNAAsn/Glu-tRNAGln amidotransferase A subunit [Opitutaceae bacterium TAV1]|nr:amidase, Asp-tRNAAsn/Glu-tRNAGln amidotransferase A subunit [Opitutaceae bacterium TAV1]